MNEGQANVGYLYHDAGSRKGTIHAAYDEAGGGERGLQVALKLAASLKRNGKPLKESTIRSWISDWNSPNGYHARRMAELASTPPRAAERTAMELADDPRPYRGIDQGQARKRAVNVTVDERILMEARTMDLNLSQILEEELRKRVKDERGRRWAEENKEFIESYNAYIERNGVFGEDLLDLDDPPV
jgi:antitoxin CcdA